MSVLLNNGICVKITDDAKQLNVVLCAVVMSRILFALPAWGGFLSNDLVAKFDAFFQKKLLALQQ